MMLSERGERQWALPAQASRRWLDVGKARAYSGVRQGPERGATSEQLLGCRLGAAANGCHVNAEDAAAIDQQSAVHPYLVDVGTRSGEDQVRNDV